MSVDIVGSFRLRLHLRFVVVFVVRFVRYRFKTKRNVSLFIAPQLKIGLKFSKKTTNAVAASVAVAVNFAAAVEIT